MKVKAKMFVDSVKKTSYGAEVVTLRAQHDDGHPENNSFAQATPCASMEMTIDNSKAHGFFVPGRSYYLDFSEAGE